MSAVTASLPLTLLFFGVLVFGSADQKIPAVVGGDVILPCQDKNNINTGAVKWWRADLKNSYVLLYRDLDYVTEYQDSSFENRVDLQDKQMKDGDVSLILKNVTINDTGTYECQVFMNVAYKTISIIKLIVDPGQTGGQEDGSVGLIIGLSVSAVLLVGLLLVCCKCSLLSCFYTCRRLLYHCLSSCARSFHSSNKRFDEQLRDAHIQPLETDPDYQ